MEYAVFSLHRLMESSMLLWVGIWVVYGVNSDAIRNKDAVNVLVHFFWWIYALIFIR